jgi:serralysin
MDEMAPVRLGPDVFPERPGVVAREDRAGLSPMTGADWPPAEMAETFILATVWRADAADAAYGALARLAAAARTEPAGEADLGELLVSSCCGGACGGHSVTAAGAVSTDMIRTATDPAVSPDVMARYLTNGFWVETGQIPHSWDTAANNVLTVDLSGVTLTMQPLIRAALEAWESVADLRFSEVRGGADITFTDEGSGATNRSVYRTDGDMVEATVIVSQSWLNSNGSTIGSYTFQTYMHEIGHALGLGHSGAYGVAGGTDYANDSWQMSVMSYNSQTENTFVNASKAVAVTPMMADIIAIQSLYGAATGSVSAGNTIYGVGATMGTYLASVFAGNGASLSRNAMTIWDESGYDRINFSNDTRSQRVDLNGQTYNNVFGLVGNLAIARGTVIEEYTAGSGNDLLFGNAVANTLRGGNGTDTLYGRDGNDMLDLGVGDDRAFGGNGNDRILAHAGNDTVFGEVGNDTLEGVDGNDFLRGDAGNDTLLGQNGNDTAYGGDGDDRVDGAAGNDTGFGGNGNDRVLGLAGDDKLYGDAGQDTLEGGDGNDLVRGDAGNDFLRGGNGNDTALGGDGNDTLYGDIGNDRLEGGNGNDFLSGGSGNDVLVGGAGRDVFVFNGGRDTVSDFQDNADTLQIDDNLFRGATLTVSEVISTYARAVDGYVLFDFGGGTTLAVMGVTQASQLADDLQIV